MLARFLRKARRHLLIAFGERYTVEGFEKTQKKFQTPENFSLLDPGTKRKLTICNLFANQDQSLWSIAHVLDAPITKVVSILIENGLIKERRVRAEKIKHERRYKASQVQPVGAALVESDQFPLPFGTSERRPSDLFQVRSQVGTERMGSQTLAS